MSRKLLEHFRRMQECAERYLIPEPYVDREGESSRVAVGSDSPVRDRLFAADIIYLLDGPEQREAQSEAEFLDQLGYPTEDAYLSMARALHWRTEQLRQAGIEPLNLMTCEEQPLPHYPPDHFRFPITECFPGDDHRQVYHAWRRFPRAMQATFALAVVIAFPLGVLVTLLIRG